MTNIDIAAKIARLRVKKQDVAARAGITPDILSRLLHDRLSGERKRDVIKRVAAVLKVLADCPQ
jgi:transcriptional regulator with XRE-family HTH domain